MVKLLIFFTNFKMINHEFSIQSMTILYLVDRTGRAGNWNLAAGRRQYLEVGELPGRGRVQSVPRRCHTSDCSRWIRSAGVRPRLLWSMP